MLGLADKPNSTIVLIDGANLFATVRNLGFNIDFKQLKQELEDSCNLLHIFYYTALVENEDNKIILRPLVDWLSYNGFVLVTKPAKVITTREGEKRIKGNMDVEIAVDALNAANVPGVTDIVLFTGDGDFCYLVEDIQKKGVRVTVVSSKQNAASMVADDLRKQCNKFIELGDWMHKLSKPISQHEMTKEEETELAYAAAAKLNVKEG